MNATLETHPYQSIRLLRPVGSLWVLVAGWVTISVYRGTLREWIDRIREDQRATERRYWCRILGD